MDLVAIGHRAEFLGNVAELGDGRDVAIHRIDGFEGDQLRPARSERGELAAQIGRVVMGENVLLDARMPDALDHRGVVERVGEDDAARDARGKRGERGPVRHIAGVEDQCRFLAVQIGKLALQQDMVVVGAADIARAARPCPRTVERLMHRREHLGMLAHAEIVVRAPDGDVARAALAVIGGGRKAADLTLQIGKDPVAALTAQAVQLVTEESLEIHRQPPAARIS